MKTSKVKIRRFKKGDGKEVNDLLQTFHNYAKVNIIDEKIVEILASRRDTYAAVVIVKENGKEMVVGFGMINLFPIADKNGLVGKFEDIVINPNYRGVGLAEKLCGKLIAFAQKHGVKEIELTCNPNRIGTQRLYKKLGFKKRETDVWKLEL